jgi:integrase
MSVHQMPNGTFKVRYRQGSKQHARSGFKTKSEARAWEADQRRRLRNHTWVDPQGSKTKIESVFREWLYEGSQVSERTRSDYLEIWSSVIAPSWGAMTLQGVTPAEVIKWVQVIKRSYSAARVRKSFSVFRQTMQWAVAQHLIETNPVARALETTPGRGLLPPARSRNSVSGTKANPLTPNQLHQLARAAAKSSIGMADYELMILVMGWTGLRFGEVTALQARDIPEVGDCIHVQRAVTDIRGRLVEGPPKSGKARTVPIPRPLHRRLESHLSGKTPESLVFTTSTGSQIRYSRFRSDVFDPAVAATGLQGITPHTLRRTFAALCVSAGQHPKITQEWMGHSDIRLTMDLYTTALDSELTRGAALMNSLAEDAISEQDVPNLFPLRSFTGA